MDTRLESVGAEFLVLGNLLLEGVEAHKSYTNFPGYDVVAVNPHKDKTCRIQVKSRWATDFDGGFPIKNFDCDFVVFVALNRGYRYRKGASHDGRKDPQFYVLPVENARAAQNPKSAVGKTFPRRLADSDQYLSNWQAIKAFLEMES